MANCLLCQQSLKQSLLFSFLFSFRPYKSEKMCGDCKADLISLTNPTDNRCSGCSRKQQQKGVCADCEKWAHMYPDYPFCHTALYEYTDMLKEWLVNYKVKGDVRMAAAFSGDIQTFVRPFIKQGFLIVPIPSGKQDPHDFKFNQVTHMLDEAKVTYDSVLMKKGNQKKQSQKNRKERMNTPQLFALNQDAKEKIKGKSILLIDDVYTTGRTMFHAAELLQQEGAIRIQSFSIVR